MADGEGRPRGRARGRLPGQDEAPPGRRPREDAGEGPSRMAEAQPAAGPSRGPPGSPERPQRPERGPTLVTRPQYPNFSKFGWDGLPYVVSANYFEVLKRPDWHLLKYRVDFAPDEEHTGVRKALLRQHQTIIGKYIFDGTLLYSPNRLPQPFEVVSEKRSSTEKIRITLRLVGEVQKGDNAYFAVMNIIVRTCLQMMNLIQIKRDYYDAHAPVHVPNRDLTVWPGYDTTIREYEDKLLLGIDTRFKIMRTDTAMQVMEKILRKVGNSGGDLKAELRAELEGKIVMTSYNKRTYRIDDIDFEKNPLSTFFYRKEDRDVTFKYYYEQVKYPEMRLRVTNDSQPLLVSRPSRRDRNRGDDQPVFLLPEFCGMTGLTEEMRKDFRLMQDVASVTRVNPQGRIDTLKRFRERFTGTPAAAAELASWRLEFSRELVECKGRFLFPQTIVQSTSYSAEMGDWSRPMQRNQFAVSPRLEKWIVFYPSQMEGEVRGFITEMQNVSRRMGFTIPSPRMKSMHSDRSTHYVNHIRDECDNMQYNIVMAVMKSQRADTYGSIKKLTCADLGIPSQVITGRILKNPNRLPAIATKVMIQMAAKLGAEPWRVQIPPQKWMVCGYDTYHDARQRRAVGAFVASLNPSFTRYVSSVTIHDNNEEISPNYSFHMVKCLRAFYRANAFLPDKIIVYRDGIGAGDIERVISIEVKSLEGACHMCAEQLGVKDYKLRVAYVIVSKRIAQRFFRQHPGTAAANPQPGLVVDNTVTLPERYDFFLVSQSVTQGCVSPTSFNVVHDTTWTHPDVHQRLAYVLTHLYYNWAGTLRVPAPCQYAHKLAYLIGENVNAMPREEISTLPYYL